MSLSKGLSALGTVVVHTQKRDRRLKLNGE